MTISKEEARVLAERFLKKCNDNNAMVTKVTTFEEWPVSPYICSDSPVDLDQCWIIGVDLNDDHLGLRSSTIIVMLKDSGEIICYGSAGDEG